jgi:hypothetical protein
MIKAVVPFGKDLTHVSGILIWVSGRGNCYDNAMGLRRQDSPPD